MKDDKFLDYIMEEIGKDEKSSLTPQFIEAFTKALKIPELIYE